MINIDALEKRLELRKNWQIYFSREDSSDEIARDVPDAWWDLCSLEKPLEKIRALWQPIEDLLPDLLDLIVEKLQAIAVYIEDGAKPKLLYVFEREKDEFYLMLGGSPLAKDITFDDTIPSDIIRFYREVHNGWVSLFNSSAGGPLAFEDWYQIDAIAYDISAERLSGYEFKLDDFTVLFTSGQGEFGILKSAEDIKYMWFFINDDESEYSESFWDEIDYELSEELSQLQE